MLNPAAPAAPRTTRATHRGLTLIELMVALVVLGGLLVLAMPSVGQWLRNIQIRNAGESLISGLQQARSEAVRRNQNVIFSLVSTASGNAGVLDSSCALSSSSASWVVSLSSPEGHCDQTPSVATTSTAAPQIIAKHAHGDGSANVTLAVRATDCTTAATTTQVTFNGFGRLANTTSLRCLNLSHSDASTRPLRVLIGANGSTRLCDPAVTATDDPRRCAIN